jgi:hypothetical protein
MVIKIGAGMIAQLPKDQREGIKDYLESKSGGICHLCESPILPASQDIEADHDEPAAAGGLTDRDNLWLAHVVCNRAKRDNPSVNVRPYLKLKNYMTAVNHVLRYDGVLVHFGIKPSPSKAIDAGATVRFEFPDGSRAESQVFTDVNKAGREFRYVFVRAPKSSLYNDDDVQPRSLKLAQVWAIYGDLQVNPLHEPPSCRLIGDGSGMAKLALFDGQHKTVASWMSGGESVTVKVYLDLSKDEANYLVNSIQAKIKKLPLSPFELSAKLSEEWLARLDAYREKEDADVASEAGFIAFVDVTEKKRAKDAFEAALIRSLIEAQDLSLTKYVHRAGQPKSDMSLITETQFSAKVLKRLLNTTPLEDIGVLGEAARGRERDNIVSALNLLCEFAFDPPNGSAELTDLQAVRRKRLVYQASLTYVADLIKQLYRQVLVLEESRAFLDKVPSDDQEKQIRGAIQRIVDHPIWTADLDQSAKTRAVNEAMQKNQDIAGAMSAVGLKLGYAVGADQLDNKWFE